MKLFNKSFNIGYYGAFLGLAMSMFFGCSQKTVNNNPPPQNVWCNAQKQCTSHKKLTDKGWEPVWDDTQPHSNGVQSVHPFIKWY
jgi:hypothetical protein